MGILKYFQRIKWQILAKLNPNYYVLSDKLVSKDREGYRKSGKDDLQKFILKNEQLKEYLENSHSKVCLEFGCGNGRMTEYFAEVSNQVYAVDISEEMLKSAQQRLSHLANIIYIRSDGERINLPANLVDFIFSYAVLQHFPNKKMVKEQLKEFHRIMKDDAIAKIQIRGHSAYGGIFRYLKWYYGVFFLKEEIFDILKEIGFKIIKSEGENDKLFWILIQKT